MLSIYNGRDGATKKSLNWLIYQKLSKILQPFTNCFS